MLNIFIFLTNKENIHNAPHSGMNNRIYIIVPSIAAVEEGKISSLLEFSNDCKRVRRRNTVL